MGKGDEKNACQQLSERSSNPWKYIANTYSKQFMARMFWPNPSKVSVEFIRRRSATVKSYLSRLSPFILASLSAKKK
jgi:hypothetical protein